MIILFFIYILTFFVVNLVLKHKHTKFLPITKAVITKKGINFHSQNVHRIRIQNSKITTLKNIIFLKNNGKVVAIKNIDRVYVENDYVYFLALGKVEILFNNEIYKYFNLVVKSENFTLRTLKERAINSIINNLFNYEYTKECKSYLVFIKNVLNINITNKGIYIKKNLYNLTFSVMYKINNKIKRVNIV